MTTIVGVWAQKLYLAYLFIISTWCKARFILIEEDLVQPYLY